MSDVTTLADLRQLELLLQSGNSTDALSLVTQRLQDDPANRPLQLYSLLTRVIAFGPEAAEAEIDGLRALSNLSESERVIIMQILDCGLEAAVRGGDAGKVWVYRRSLRRLAAGLPLDRPFAPQRLAMQMPAAGLTARQLAAVRDIFLAAPDNPRAHAAGRARHLADTIKKNRRRLVELQKRTADVVARVSPRCLAAGRSGWQHAAALVDTHLIRNTSSRPTIALVLALVAITTGWKLIGEKSSQVPKLDRSAAAKPQILPVPGAPSSALGSAANRARDAKNGVVSEQARGAGDAKQRVVDGRAAAMRGAGKSSASLFQAVQTVGLRGEPRYGAAKEHSLESGARVVVVESRGNWLKVRSEANGATGYVRKEFLARRPPPHSPIGGQAKR